jgi:hypothetical protein
MTSASAKGMPTAARLRLKLKAASRVVDAIIEWRADPVLASARNLVTGLQRIARPINPKACA